MAEYNAGEARLKIVPDASGFKAKLEAELKKIDADLPIRVSADLAQAKADIERFREVQRRNGIQLGVQADITRAAAKVDAWRRAQESNDLTLKVDADTRTATDKVESLGKSVAGIFDAVRKNLGLNLTVAGLNELPAAGTAIASVAGAVQQLGQSGLVLPGILAGVAASAGTAKLGMHGMAEAIGKMYAAAQSGDAKDLKKVAESLKDMAPNAIDTAQAIGKVIPEFEKLRKGVQQNMFDGVGQAFTDLTNKQLPTLTAGMGKVSTAWNGTLKSILGAAGSNSSKTFLDQIFGNTADAQTKANAAVAPIVHALGQLSATGTKALPRLADGLTSVTTRFDNFISKAAGDGRLDKWINDGINAVTSFGRSALNIGKIFTDITKAVGGDGGFFKLLETGTGKLEKFLGSADGQAKLSKFFSDGRQQIRELLPVLKDLGHVLGDAFKGIQQWGGIITPVLGGITKLMASMPGVTTGAITAMLGFRTVKPVIDALGGSFTSLAATMGGGAVGAGKPGTVSAAAKSPGALSNLWLAGMANANPRTALAMAQAQRWGGNLKNGVKGAFSDRGIAGILTAAAGSSIEQSAETTGGKLLGAGTQILGAGLTGAAIGGTIGGPPGAAIGATVASLAATAKAAYDWIASDAEKSAARAAAAADKHKAALEELDQAMRASRQSDKELGDSLLASGGKQDADTLGSISRMIGSQVDLLSSGNPDAAKDFKTALDALNLSDKSLAEQVGGSQEIFDALEARLAGMGPVGKRLADVFADVHGRFTAAQAAGANLAPVLENLVGKFGTDVPAVADHIRTAFAAIPKNTPINVNDEGAKAAIEVLESLHVKMHFDEKGILVVDDKLPQQAITTLQNINVAIDTINGHQVVVAVDQASVNDALNKLGQVGDAYRNLLGGALKLPAIQGPPNLNTQAADPFALPGQPTAPASPGVSSILPGSANLNTQATDPFALPPQRKATGGPVTGGVKGVDSVPLLGQHGEYVLDTGDVARMGGFGGVDRFRKELAAGRVRGYEGGGGIGEDPNKHYGTGFAPGPVDPSAPVAPNPMSGGGIGNLASSLLSGLGNVGSNIKGLLPGNDGGTGTAGGDAPKLMPGIAGLFQAGNNPDLLSQWTNQTADKVGNILGSGLLQLGTAIWDKGILGFFGLQNSILSSSNPWFQDAARTAGFVLGNDGPLSSGRGKTGKQVTSQQLREAQDKVTDRQTALATAQARLSELGPKAKPSQRMAAQNAVDKATRELAEAQSDLGQYQQGVAPSSVKAGAPSGGNAGVAYQAMLDAGYGPDQWPALRNILNSESGFNNTAKNPKSTAYGMFQFLDSTWGTVGGAKTNDPALQAKYGLDYIRQRYGTPAAAWSYWQANHSYATGGHTPGSRSTPLPAILHGNEFVQRASAVDKYGVSFMSALNEGRIDPNMLPHFELGGHVEGLIPPPHTPTPIPDAQIKTRGATPVPNAPVTPLPAPPVPIPGTTTAAPDNPPPPAEPEKPRNDYPGQATLAPAPTNLNHNLDALNTGITSGASAIGNAVATAVSSAAAAGSFGAGAAGASGAMGSLVSGLFTEGGKVVQGAANVASSALVGNVPGSFGSGNDRAFGQTMIPQQAYPQPNIGRSTTYNLNGISDINALMDRIELSNSIASQAEMAHHR